jgi:hypothetical protein
MGASDAAFRVPGLDGDEFIGDHFCCVEFCLHCPAVSRYTRRTAGDAVLQGASGLVEVLE